MRTPESHPPNWHSFASGEHDEDGQNKDVLEGPGGQSAVLKRIRDRTTAPFKSCIRAAIRILDSTLKVVYSSSILRGGFRHVSSVLIYKGKYGSLRSAGREMLARVLRDSGGDGNSTIAGRMGMVNVATTATQESTEVVDARCSDAAEKLATRDSNWRILVCFFNHNLSWTVSKLRRTEPPAKTVSGVLFTRHINPGPRFGIPVGHAPDTVTTQVALASGFPMANAAVACLVAIVVTTDAHDTQSWERDSVLR
ncbi:hypothetical protein IW262DRAFT_1296972 [Armillaria fumosa]|nr:hypothetical protein IW262DRAFT_1296972 [Armillaria fumosa]